MGRVQHASALATLFDSSLTSSPLMVRNTFLELKELEPPCQQKITRARTAPEQQDSSSCASSSTCSPPCSRCPSARDVDSESCSSRSSAAGAGDRDEHPAAVSSSELRLPLVQRSSLRTPSATSLSSCLTNQDEMAVADDEEEPQLRVKNTFYEVVVPSRSKPKRSKSMPLSELAQDLDDDEVDTATEEEDLSSSQEDDVIADSSACGWSTPMDDDSPRLQGPSGFMNAFFGQVSVGSVAPQPQPLQPSVAPAAGQAAWTMVPLAFAPPAQTRVPSPAAPVARRAEAEQEHREHRPPQQQQVKEEEERPQLSKASPSKPSSTASDRKARVTVENLKRRQRAPNASDCKAWDLITEAVEAGRDHRHSSVWQLARKDGTSSALVQKSIDFLAEERHIANQTGDEDAIDDVKLSTEAVICALHGHVRTAIEHPHANYVLQRAAEVLPTEHLSFVATELKGKAVWASKHRFGCRTILRLVARCQEEWEGQAVSQLIEEILPFAHEMACDQFGNYVIQEVLEHGLPHQRHAVAQALLRGLGHTAGNQQGSRVVEKALKHCEANDVQTLADTLLSDRSLMRRLAASEYGCLVLKPLLRSEQHGNRAAGVLRPFAGELRKTRQGRRLLNSVLGHA